MAQRTRFHLWWMGVAVYSTLVFLLPGLLLAYCWGLSAAPGHSIIEQIDGMISLLPKVAIAIAADPLRFVQVLWSWYLSGRELNGIGPWPLVAAVGTGLVALAAGLAINPYDAADTTHGSSRLATMNDLQRWKRPRMVPGWIVALCPPLLLLPDFHKRESLDLLDHAGVVLGRFKGKLLRTSATLSTLVLAAPGTGKTTGVAIPTLLAPGNEAWSMVIFDIKGELYDLTGGRSMGLYSVSTRRAGNRRNGIRFRPPNRFRARMNTLERLSGRQKRSGPSGGRIRTMRLPVIMRIR